MNGTVHIYAPAPGSANLVPGRCPTCQRDRWFLRLSFEWFGPELTCLRCGEHWNEDGRAERPFARFWRRDAVASARASARRHGAKITWKAIQWR